MGASLQVLYLEDDPDFVNLVDDLLLRDGLTSEIEVVDNYTDFITRLDGGGFDVIIADYQLPTCNGLQALQAARQKAPDTPFLLISGVIGERTAVESLKSGATDYILKSGLDRLVPAVRRALGDARERAQHRRLEIEIMRRDQYFRALTEHSLDILSIVSRDGTIQYTSPSVKPILGYDSQALFGRNAFELVHPDDLPGATQAFELALKHPERRIKCEYRYRRQNGTWCYIETIGQNHLDNPEVAGVVLNARDATERKRAEAELKKTQDELVRAATLAETAEIAACVVHDIGNVLTSLTLSADMISMRLNNSKANNVSRVAALMREHTADIADFMSLDPKGKLLPDYLRELGVYMETEQTALRDYVETIMKSMQHIKRIAMMQQSYAQMAGTSESVAIPELIEDALQLNASNSKRQDIQIVRDYSPQVPQITVKRHRILQVLVNLIRNAEHSIDESGRQEKRLTFQVSTRGGRVCIAVIDNGVGIALENLTRVFEHGFTTRKEGHGIGLHSSALAVKEMAGTLTAQSDGYGLGATFTIELPLEPRPPEPSQRNSSGG